VPDGLRIQSSGRVLARNVRWARSWRDRSRGLLGSSLKPGEALVLTPAKQVHTFGMGYPIDVVFCDSSWTIRHIARSVAPRRLTRIVFSARYVVELPSKSVPDDLTAGERLSVDQPSSDL
jgi:uncharacterized membrane protein (UPF0127 family)